MSRFGTGCLRCGAIALVALVLSFLAASEARAGVYSYQGKNFTNFSGNPVYDVTMGVSGSFELPLPLPPNLPLSSASGNVQSFSFFDGVDTRTEADSVICSFDLATDVNGRIVQWRIFLRSAGIAVGNPQHTLLTERSAFSAIDTGDHLLATGDDCVEGAVGTDQGVVNNDPGTWTSDVVSPVPTLGTWTVVLLGGLLALLGISVLRRRQLASPRWTPG